MALSSILGSLSAMQNLNERDFLKPGEEAFSPRVCSVRYSRADGGFFIVSEWSPKI